MSGKCSECGEYTLQCRCHIKQSLPNISDMDSTLLNQDFWAAAYEKFERWERAQRLFYMMTWK
jgi:hypothetical protein